MTTPAERLCSRSWRLRNSLWIAPVILLAGIATWASFLYIGLKAKRKSWLIAAGVFGVGAIVTMTLIQSYSDGVKGTSSAGENASGWVTVLLWLGGIAYAVKSNREWLKWKAHAQPSASWYAPGSEPAAVPAGEPTVDDLLLGRTSTPPAPPPPPPWAAQIPGAPEASGDEAQPPPSSAPVAGDPAPTTSRGTTESGRLVDLNAASAGALEAGLGLDRALAEKVVTERARLGRFTDVEQLMTVAGVEPHVFAGIRHRATIGDAPRPSGPAARGRRLDL